MDTKEIEDCLKGRLGIKVNYVGIFTSDQVGKIDLQYSRDNAITFISNTLEQKDNPEIMSDWVAFYIDASPIDRIVFFDSYGINPFLYCRGFQEFILRNKKFDFYTFDKQYQPNISYKCGLYVSFFIHYTSLVGIKKTIEKIKDVLSESKKTENDRYILRYYLKYLSKGNCSNWHGGGKRAVSFSECKAINTNRRKLQNI